MMSLGPVASVSYVNLPWAVASATETERMPGRLISVDSMRCTQDAQNIPSICDRSHHTWGQIIRYLHDI